MNSVFVNINWTNSHGISTETGQGGLPELGISTDSRSRHCVRGSLRGRLASRDLGVPGGWGFVPCPSGDNTTALRSLPALLSRLSLPLLGELSSSSLIQPCSFVCSSGSSCSIGTPEQLLMHAVGLSSSPSDNFCVRLSDSKKTSSDICVFS